MLQKLKDTRINQAVADMHYGYDAMRKAYVIESSMSFEVSRALGDAFIKVIESVIGSSYTNKLLYIIERPEYSTFYTCMYVYDGRRVGILRMADNEEYNAEVDEAVVKAISKWGLQRPAMGKTEVVVKAGNKHEDRSGAMDVACSTLINPTLLRGQLVMGRDGKDIGVLSGATHKCQMEGCTGVRMTTRWSTGKYTHPCSKGMSWDNSQQAWRII